MGSTYILQTDIFRKWCVQPQTGLRTLYRLARMDGPDIFGTLNRFCSGDLDIQNSCEGNDAMSGSFRPTGVLIVLTFVFAPFWTHDAVVAESPEKVQLALEALSSWSKGKTNAEGWLTFLMTDELRSELEKGNEADPTLIAEVIERYSWDTSVLDRKPFAAVRKVLEQWQRVMLLPNVEELPELIRAATSDFSPLEENHLEKSRQSLVIAVARLNQFLSRERRSKVNGWKQYLLWGDLQAELENSANPSLRVLARVHSKYRAQYGGLELPPFQNVRETLGKYGEALSYDGEHFQQQFETTMGELAENLESYVEEPSPQNASDASIRLGWLKRGGQVPELIETVRHFYVQPNFHLNVSGELVSVGFRQEIDKTEDLRNNAGPGVSGESHTVGNVTSRLIPNDDQAEVEVAMVATMHARTRKVSGPAVILTSAVTSIDARKRVFVNGDGFGADPAQARCTTNINLEDVRGSREVQRQAWPRARAALPRAETTSARRTERKISTRLDQEIDEIQIDGSYRDNFLRPLIVRGEPPAIFHFVSTEDSIICQSTQANDFQFAAHTPPVTLEGDYDLVTRFHESYINNYVESVYGGATLTDVQAAELIEQVTGEVPEKMQPDPNAPWTVTFIRRRPITISFAHNTYTVMLRGKKFSAGEKTITSMHITASYKFEMTPTGARRVRVGDIKIQPANFASRKKKTLSPGETAEKSVLKRQFQRIFPSVIEPTGLEMPGRWRRAGRLVSREVLCENSWLAVGWQRAGQAEPTTDFESNKTASLR